jgi:hypothetical protein
MAFTLKKTMITIVYRPTQADRHIIKCFAESKLPIEDVVVSVKCRTIDHDVAVTKFVQQLVKLAHHRTHRGEMREPLFQGHIRNLRM